jgi:hypothetical protein
MVQISVDRVKEIIRLNKKGIKVDKLNSDKSVESKKALDYENVVGQDSLSRFDKKDNPNKRKGKRKFRRPPRKTNKPAK